MDLITHIDDLPAYAPPGHSGTRNIRLADRAFCGHFEMVLGEIAPGGVADPHAHDTEYQAMYVISGRAEVTLGDRPAVECGPGTMVRIPPKVMHKVVATGEEPLKLILVYSPPLPPRDEVALTGEAR
jgi:mannose-6-phosphate isomerase-like protein (cupin superfamily)